MTEQDVRWKQRFQNFSRAFNLLRSACEEDLANFSQLEKEGVIQRFEYTFELAWKVLKDKMQSDGLLLDQLSPKAVVRQAYAAGYIEDIDAWLDMIGDRNLMSHTYDFSKFESVILTIQSRYLHIMDGLYTQLLEAQLNDG